MQTAVIIKEKVKFEFHDCNRIYDPVSKTFLSADSYFLENFKEVVRSPVEGNLFSYAGNNPLIKIDNDGNKTENFTLLIGVYNDAKMLDTIKDYCQTRPRFKKEINIIKGKIKNIENDISKHNNNIKNIKDRVQYLRKSQAKTGKSQFENIYKLRDIKYEEKNKITEGNNKIEGLKKNIQKLEHKIDIIEDRKIKLDQSEIKYKRETETTIFGKPISQSSDML